MHFDLNFPYSLGIPLSTGHFRSEIDDFIVTENLGFPLEGEGEHLYVCICKRGENTGWIAEKLAKFFNIKTSDVGYAGMKDRYAKTTQWFSLYLPKKVHDLDWNEFIAFSEANLSITESSWHKKKLRRGEHESNSFVIRLRNVSEIDDALLRSEKIKQYGVPNYFGEQRFGRDANNLTHAKNWFEHGEVIRKQKLRGIVISAARSYLFNQVLGERVRNETWETCLPGDIDSYLPTGPLWGRGNTLVSEDSKEIESKVLAQFELWKDGLEHCGLSQERRSLVLRPDKMEFYQKTSDLILEFTLPPGQFATSVLREIAQLVQVVPSVIKID